MKEDIKSIKNELTNINSYIDNIVTILEKHADVISDLDYQCSWLRKDIDYIVTSDLINIIQDQNDVKQ